ncbi:MAG: redox-regulated ATPase YchF [Thermoanaerobaculales bacterium]|jgi:GTP-binding protein YchF|nr:redox-regulated ATPase YchF [Thermoanaerobaculales bacterium]
MEVGIMGLAASGKSSLFGLLTGQDSSAPTGRRDQTQVGMAKVPDPRLDVLAAMYKPKKTTPATIRFSDVPGIPDEHRGEASLNLPELRTADALMVVLRAFDSDAVAHPKGSVDPLRDLTHIEEEFILSDQLVVEKRLERLRKDIQKRRDPELERERDLLERCLAVLEAEQPLRNESFDANEEKKLRGFTFLSRKPMLVVANVGEDDPSSDVFVGPEWEGWTSRQGLAFTRVCATLEAELAELDGDDAEAFMEDLGLEDRALDRIIGESYALLGLISFFTVGDDECRAWSILEGTEALAAAGEIHSDIQRGFIRAEVVTCEELLETGSLSGCRQKGTLRLEGKTYRVHDGEVVHFRFNV